MTPVRVGNPQFLKKHGGGLKLLDSDLHKALFSTLTYKRTTTMVAFCWTSREMIYGSCIYYYIYSRVFGRKFDMLDLAHHPGCNRGK